MTGLVRGLQDWLRRRPAAVVPPDATPQPPSPPETSAEPDLFQLAEGLEDEAACSEELLAGVAALIASRRRSAGVEDAPASPALSGLRVRRLGLPDWWNEGRNLLLVGEGATPPTLNASPHAAPPRHAVVAIGAGSRFDHINLGMTGPLVVLGDGVIAPSAAMTCLGSSSVLVGETTTCTNWAILDCRNGGIIVIGADGMWANAVSVMTDDAHAIRDARTGERLNAFGGRIVVDRHVWLCEHARLLDGARVGTQAVVGANSVVKRSVVAPNTVVVGAPARTVRSDITWNREDAP